MGQCTSTANKPKKPVVSLSFGLDNKIEIGQVPPTLASLHSLVKQHFSPLHYMPYSIRVHKSNITSDDELTKLNLTTNVSLKVCEQPASSAVNQVSLNVFKLIDTRSTSVIGTGFVLFKHFAVIGSVDQEGIRSKAIKAMFVDRNNTQIDIHAERIGTQIPRTNPRFTVVELDFSAAKPLLEAMRPISWLGRIEADIKGTVLYYGRAFPQLKECKNSVLKLQGKEFFLFPTKLLEGSTGAPVFNSDNKLIGVYMSDFYKNIGSVFMSFPFWQALDVPLTALSEIEQFKAFWIESVKVLKGKYDQPEESEEEEEVKSESDTEPEQEYMKGTYSFRFDSQQLAIYQPEAKVKYSFDFLTTLEVGCSLTPTPSGLAITGQSSRGQGAWLWKTNDLLKLIRPAHHHLFHCSVYYKRRLYCISGVKTGECEYMDFESYEWRTIEPLPAPRANAAAVVCGDKIYVVGGRVGSSDLYRESILEGDGDTWEVLDFKFPMKIINHAIACFGSRFIVFGGETFPFNSRDAPVPNSDSYIVSPTKPREEEAKRPHKFTERGPKMPKDLSARKDPSKPLDAKIKASFTSTAIVVSEGTCFALSTEGGLFSFREGFSEIRHYVQKSATKYVEEDVPAEAMS
jgi:hypothetical protein